jgi:hypothetical protein
MKRLPFFITTIKPDKSLLSEIRGLFMGSTISNGHEYTDRQVYFYPEDIFCVEDNDGEKIFFLMVIPMNGNGNPEKRPIPIFMCNFTRHQKKKIMEDGTSKGFEILYKYFLKPSICISKDERLDYVPVDEIEMADETLED